MTTPDFIFHAQYTRSINLARDAQATELVTGYVPTARAVQTLGRLAETFDAAGVPRAWALTGPYGSGKSAFALFLSHLLAAQTTVSHQAAVQVLRETEPELAAAFDAAAGESGYLVVLVTGSPEPLGRRLVQALAMAAAAFWAMRAGRAPTVLAELQRLSELRRPPVLPEIVAALADLQTALKGKCRGVLLVVDELGKFLEYEARHLECHDSFLLQLLAEHAQSSQAVPLLLLTLMHQAFEQYAQGAGERLKNEWAKIGGRFEHVAFLDSADQILRVVARAFAPTFAVGDFPHIAATAAESARVLAEAHALPAGLSVAEAERLFCDCYPLHPVTLLLLPVLCQKVAQNERTLFSYLTGQEAHSMRRSLAGLSLAEPSLAWVLPGQLYDYFFESQTALSADWGVQKRWAEVASALERVETADPLVVMLLKTIGLLNLVGSQGGFKASPAVLGLCFPSFEAVLPVLSSQSLVTFRGYSGEYRVWQGSDFDLPAVLREKIGQLGDISAAKLLNEHFALSPILARRHAFKTGVLRYFVPYFSDTYFLPKRLNEEQKTIDIYIFLAEDSDQQKFFDEKVKGFARENVVLACLSEGQALKEKLLQWDALRQIESERAELTSDAVAKREFQQYLQHVYKEVVFWLQNLVSNPQDLKWFYKGEPWKLVSRRQLQFKLSNLLDDIYDESPCIHNELINRSRPSTSAMSGRNRLLQAMFENPEKLDLGIDKFPPEKAIYRSVLQHSKLHRPRETGFFDWHFAPPLLNDDPCNLLPVWDTIEQYFNGTEKKPASLTKLAKSLELPPYGMTAGLIPIIIITAYLIYQHELALYENDVFVPVFRLDILDRLRKSLDQALLKETNAQRIQIEFKIQHFRMEGINKQILQQYVNLLKNIKFDPEKPDILAIVKPFAKFMGSLPDYTFNTQTLSAQTQAVLNAYQAADSPQAMLLHDLPAACGFERLDDDIDNETLKQFSDQLMESLQELNNAYRALLQKLQNLLAHAFSVSKNLTLPDLRNYLFAQHEGLEQYLNSSEKVYAFTQLLLDQSGDDIQWIERIFSFLANKPVKQWQDQELETVEVKLTTFFIELKNALILHTRSEQHKKSNNAEFDAILLSCRQTSKGEVHDVAFIDANFRPEAIKVMDALYGQLIDFEPDQRKAVVALLVNKILESEAK